MTRHRTSNFNPNNSPVGAGLLKAIGFFGADLDRGPSPTLPSGMQSCLHVADLRTFYFLRDNADNIAGNVFTGERTIKRRKLRTMANLFGYRSAFTMSQLPAWCSAIFRGINYE